MEFQLNGIERQGKEDYLTWKVLPAAMAAIVLRAIFPDLVFGSLGTRTASLKLATGPTHSLTCLTTSSLISFSDLSIPGIWSARKI